MKKIYNPIHSKMDVLHTISPKHPATAHWIMQEYVNMERELAYPETTDKQVWDTWKEALRSRLRELMYIDSWGDVTRVPQYEVLEEQKCYNYTRQKICFQSVPGNYAIAYLLIPEDITGKVPGVVCPSGHFTKHGALCIVEPEKMQEGMGAGVAYGHELALQGCVTITLENAGYGERDVPKKSGQAGGCELLYRRLNHLGRDITGFRIFELTLCLNLLSHLPMVDSNKIGCAGLSGGCWLSQVLTALDDRIKAVVLSSYFTTFAQTAWNEYYGHCWCHHPHGIGRLCDMTDLSALIAPRPQFVESGSVDFNYPPEPAYSIVRKAYEYWDAASKLHLHVFEGGHMFNGEQSIPWLVEVLNNRTRSLSGKNLI